MSKKRVDLEGIKKISLDILMDIDRVCRENDIKYSIVGGTLLGAVRHGGYIPWDDDVDIAMLRPEYEKFLGIYPKKGKYKLFDNRTHPDYYYLFGKVVDGHTELIEDDLNRIKGMGICVDVFPVDRVDSKGAKRKVRKLNFYKKGLMKNIFDIEKTSKSKLRLILKKMIYRKDFQYYHDKLSELMQSENGDETDKVSIQGEMFKNLWMMPRNLYDEYIDIGFEGKKVRCMKDYKTFLEIRYGDYMTLPPVEERKAHPRKVYFRDEEK